MVAAPRVEIFAEATGPLRMVTKMEAALSGMGLQIFLHGMVGPYIQKRAKERFQSEGDDVSGQWAQLLPATVAIRQQGQWAIGGAHPINRRSGELEAWVTDSNWLATPSPVGAILQYPRTAPKGELAKKVNTAQRGGQAPGAKTPTVPRPVLGVNERDLLAVTEFLFFYLEKAIK